MDKYESVNTLDIYKEEFVMKVLILNGSPRRDGNTSIAVSEMVKIFEAENIEPEVGRNDPCPCGSGKKYKNCCGK